MIILAFIISFIIHCISLLAVFILYSRQTKFAGREQKAEKLSHELDELLNVYLAELKKENNDLRKLLSEMEDAGKSGSLTAESQAAAADESAVDREFPPPINLVQDKLELSETAKKKHFKEILKKEIADGKQTGKAETLEEQVIRLRQEGHSIEEIAKTLHKGKKEIELMITFRS